MRLQIIASGAGIALHDAGRPGWRRFGVPISGSMDRHAMRAANQLLGNRPHSPVLEIQLLGAKILVLEDCWLALAGADHCPQLPAWSAKEVKSGSVLEFTARGDGIYSYLAVPGGFRAERWFGSVSVDPRNGIGEPISKGSVLIAEQRRPAVSTQGIACRRLPGAELPDYSFRRPFVLWPGPQFDSFGPEARDLLVRASWSISPRSDRTGYRLEGPAIDVPEQIPSEPVLPGSVQVPGNGLPIVTMNDGPTVGGYPKIAVLQDADRDRLAQCAPGTQIAFQWAYY